MKNRISIGALIASATYPQEKQMTTFNFDSDTAGQPPGGAFRQPLLALDTYQHAYALDYGAAAAKYLDAFFQTIQWDAVNRRLESAQRRSS